MILLGILAAIVWALVSSCGSQSPTQRDFNDYKNGECPPGMSAHVQKLDLGNNKYEYYCE